MYKKMYLMLAISFTAFGQEGYQKYLNLQMIKSSSIVAPLALGKLSLYYGHGAYKIKLNKKFYDVEHCWVDPMLRGIDTQRLGAFLRAGYISINKLNSGEYILRGHIKGHGGGPIAGAIAYWVTKSLCYGTAAAPVAVGSAATAGAIGIAGLTSEAVAVSTGVLAGSGGIAGAIALVESASTAAGTAFAVMPFLP